MGGSKKLLVQLSVTEKDFNFNADRLVKSLRQFYLAVQTELTVLIVYQTNGKFFPDQRFIDFPFVRIHVTNSFNVSAARNAAINLANQERYDYLVFHDSSMYFTLGFHRLINHALKAGGDIYKGQLLWASSLAGSDRVGTFVCRKKKVFPLMDQCVCLYVFRTEYLRGVFFNERIGPGVGTFINAGEDVVFLNDLFLARKSNVVDFAHAALVVHPPRPTDNSKRIQYAEAQGLLLRWFFGRGRFSVSVLIYFFLFFGNSLVGILLGRKNFRAIFKLRLKGFLDKRKLRQFFVVDKHY